MNESSAAGTPGIGIGQVVETVRKVFEGAKAATVHSVYERDGDELKLIVTMTHVAFAKALILYTKLIFWCDEGRTKITRPYFKYLSEINGKYERVDFTIGDLESKLRGIFANVRESFGPDLLTLSGFMTRPAALLNEWLADHGTKWVNVKDVTYEPKVKSVSSKNLTFAFEVEANDSKVEFILTKAGDNEYRYSFRRLDETESKEETSLRNLVEVVGTYLKENVR